VSEITPMRIFTSPAASNEFDVAIANVLKHVSSIAKQEHVLTCLPQDLRSRRILPSAERYFIFMLYFVFALYERKNEAPK
jgi:hypothetical protein